MHCLITMCLCSLKFFFPYNWYLISQCSCLENPMDVGPGRLQSMGLLRVRHDWATSFSLFTFMHWRRKWQPTPVFLPGEFQGRGAWWAAAYGLAQTWTRLKRLSSSSSSSIIVLWSEKILDIISVSLNLLRFYLGPKMRRMFHVHLRKKCILLHLDGNSWRYQLGPFGLMFYLRFVFPYWFSVFMICSLV